MARERETHSASEPGQVTRPSVAPDDSPETECRSRKDHTQLAHAALAAAMTGVISILWAHSRELGPVDDAFISLRYAANWAGNNGLSFNPGERVEGYTNFLWVVLQAVAIRCGLVPELAMKLLGWATLVALAAIFVRFAIEHICPKHPLGAAATAILVCTNPVLVCWSAAGMESCLFALLLFAAACLIVGSGKMNSTRAAALCLILAAMTRPEAVALFPIFALLAFLKHRTARSMLEFALSCGLGYGIYFIPRALYFGYLLPNTFYAKLDYGNALLFQRGISYVWDFVLAAPLLVAAAAMCIFLIRKAPLWVQGFFIIAMTQMLIVVYEGGDHFAMFRFMVPVVPFLSALALYPGMALAKRFDLRIGSTLGMVLGFLAVGLSNITVGQPPKRDDRLRFSQIHRFVAEAHNTKEWAEMGDWFGRNASAGASVCVTGIGAVGYYSGLTVIDPLGITDTHIAHQARTLGEQMAGHEKYDTPYVFAKAPSYIVLLQHFTNAPLTRQQEQRNLWAPSQREMFAAEQIANEYRYENIRVGSKFLNLYVRRDLPTPGGSSGPGAG